MDMGEEHGAHSNYKLTLCDVIINVAPFTNIAAGFPPGRMEDVPTGRRHQLDLIASAGQGSSAAIVQLFNTFRPSIVMTSHELTKCRDVWALYAPEEGEQEPQHHDLQVDPERTHSLLLICHSSGSRVLVAKDDLEEAVDTGFSTSHRTITAGNILGYQYIVQVTSKAVVLLRGTTRITELRLPSGTKVRSAHVVDPYITLLLSDGSVKLYTFAAATKTLEEVIFDAAWQGHVATVSLYCDTSGVFALQYDRLVPNDEPAGEDQLEEPLMDTDADVAQQNAAVDSAAAEVPADNDDKRDNTDDDVDDDDAFLYGDETEDSKPAPAPAKAPRQQAPTQQRDPAMYDIHDKSELLQQDQPHEVQPTYWAVVATKAGALHICSVPNMVEAFHCPPFLAAPTLVWDSLPQKQGVVEAEDKHAAADESDNGIAEVLVYGFGGGQRPHVLMRTKDAQLIIYQVFPFPPAAADRERSLGRLRLRMRKVKQHVLRLEETDISSSVRRLRPFSNIARCDGVFVAGPRPLWIMAGLQLKSLSYFPMAMDGGVKTFSYLNSRACSKGFIYFNQEGTLRVAIPPRHVSFNRGIMTRRVAIRQTVHDIKFDPESRQYALVTIDKRPEIRRPRSNNDPPAHLMPEYVYGKDEPQALTPYFQLQIFSPRSLSLVKAAKLEFPLHEHVTAFNCVKLSSSVSISGSSNLVVVGLSHLEGQHTTTNGSIQIYQIVNEEKEGVVVPSYKRVTESKQKGCVSVLDRTKDGFLVGSVVQRLGSKIFVWSFKDGETLQPLAYYEAGIYTTRMRVAQNMIAIGDYDHGVELLNFNWQKGLQSMEVFSTTKYRFYALLRVGSDPVKSRTYGLDFIIRGNDLAVMHTDDKGNMTILDYNCYDPDTKGGRILNRSANYNLGQLASATLRIQCSPSADSASKDQCLLLLTQEGATGLVTPLDETIYRRLEMLESRLVRSVTHTAGCNPKEFRAYVPSRWQPRLFTQGTLDGNLIEQFFTLGHREQVSLLDVVAAWACSKAGISLRLNSTLKRLSYTC
eukprot:TRINITY_DN11293_c0_g1_i6.p1 TRINITY_DN11293_c0_g1~~TRINITY_DN11293_c0_g1_i6.p1  ORF type:complete len:1049 (+),score=221.50 TRINITY_DN11293_c0_g1_i6:58-3147(+)